MLNKMISSSSMMLMIGVLFLAGCDTKPKYPAITEWQSYQNPYFKMQFRYPKGWYAAEEGGSVKLYTTQAAALKFFEKVEGVEAEVSFAKTDSMTSLETYVSSMQKDLTDAGYEVQPISARTLDDTPASVLSYRGALDEKTQIRVIQAVAMKDTMTYTVKYSGLNDQYAAYQAVFDTIMASIKLPKASAGVSQSDPSLPAEDFVEFDNKFLKLSHPSNFETATPAPKGETQFSLELKGYRQDCTIRVDVLPAKGLTVEKVVEQNSKFYKGASAPRATKISGENALFFNYSLVKGIESRAYFTVKNDKTYRVLMNYFQPMRADFLPAFEKVVASLQIK